MRYTTIIDIREWPRLYANLNIRIVYLHLVLISGYHDHDRDLANVSLRNLARGTGLTVSTVRNALQQLSKAGLVQRQGELLHVEKWVLNAEITPRARTKKQQQRIEAAAAEQTQREQRAREMAIEEQRRRNLRAAGKTEFMVYYEDLQAKAAAGDQEAALAVERHRATYLMHQRTIEQEQKLKK